MIPDGQVKFHYRIPGQLREPVHTSLESLVPLVTEIQYAKLIVEKEVDGQGIKIRAGLGVEPSDYELEDNVEEAQFVCRVSIDGEWQDGASGYETVLRKFLGYIDARPYCDSARNDRLRKVVEEHAKKYD